MRSSQAFQIRTAVTLRALLGVGLACLVLSAQPGWRFGFAEGLLLAFFVSNVPLAVAGSATVRWRSFDLVIVTFDTVVVSLLIFTIGGSHLALVFFLVLLVVSLGERVAIQLVTATALAGMDAWLVVDAGNPMTSALLLRIPFFYAVALYYGFFVRRIHVEREEAERVQIESRELRTIVELIQDVTSSLDPQQVMRKVVARINDVVPARRISVLMMDQEQKQATVLATTADPSLDSLQLDLEKYPELRESLRHQEPLLIEDATHHELLAPVRETLEDLDFNSFLMVPLVFAEEALGTLLLHAASRETGFDPEQVRFCRTVAAISANALKNAMLHQQLRRNAEFHEATAEELGNIFDHSPDLIVTADGSGAIVRCNKGTELLLGAGGGNAVGLRLEELYPGLCASAVRRHLETGSPWVDHEAKLRCLDGSLRETDITVVPMAHDGDGGSGFLLVGRDVTELNASRRALQHADRLKGVGEIASGVAHELNNSLTGVLGNAQLLQRQDGLSDKSLRTAEKIAENAQRCGRIVQNLLGFSRRRSADQEVVSLNGLLDTVLELYSYRMKKADVRVERSYDAGLPPTALAPNRMEQVFLNLIQNAVRSLSEQEGRRIIEVRTRLDGDTLLAEVADNGPGVPPEIRDQIFEPFFTTTETEGTGLGLSIAAGIVDEHSGELRLLDSTEGGATFQVRLPYRREVPRTGDPEGQPADPDSLARRRMSL